MSQLVITHNTDDDDWSVWMGLEDGDPVRDQFGFVIGVGGTRDQAVESAVADLEEALAQLQNPAGTIEERQTP